MKFAIATRDVYWCEDDLAECRAAQIAVISDGELDYYAALAQHLKHAARYQLLGHMLSGQKVDGLAQKSRSNAREDGRRDVLYVPHPTR